MRFRFHGVRRLRRSGALRSAAWALRCANGYRSAKRQGKPNSAKRCKPLRNTRSLHFAAAIARAVYIPFIAIIKLLFNFDGS
jgi:hypothetical protein